MIHFYFNPSILVPYVCYIYIKVLSSPLVIYFCDWAVFTLHCLEGNSLECSIRLLSATHHTLFFDLHPSMPDGVHGLFLFLQKLQRTRQLNLETSMQLWNLQSNEKTRDKRKRGLHPWAPTLKTLRLLVLLLQRKVAKSCQFSGSSTELSSLNISFCSNYGTRTPTSLVCNALISFDGIMTS